MSRLNWKDLLTPWRFDLYSQTRTRAHCIDPARSPFATDIDRITFSDSFRRLARKSQVHPLALNDHLHNRLSHSLEASCVGRSLGYAAGSLIQEKKELPGGITPAHVGEIVQAACLAHDIGNPPFGHAGEEALREWFLLPENQHFITALDNAEQEADFKCFDGNAQGFRVITRLEMAGPSGGGMRLTWPVLTAMVKYPRAAYDASRAKSNKYNFHISERPTFDAVFTRLGLTAGKDNFLRHPLSYLTEAADDICYSVIDLEDALELRLISLDDFRDLYADVPFFPARPTEPFSRRAYASHARAIVIGHLIALAAECFTHNYDKIMEGELEGSLPDNSPELNSYVEPAKALAARWIYSEKRKNALEVGSYTIYKTLLDTFIPAVHGALFTPQKQPPYKQRKALELLHQDFTGCALYDGYRKVIDYITGMTDSYATFLAQQFLGAGTGPWQM